MVKKCPGAPESANRPASSDVGSDASLALLGRAQKGSLDAYAALRGQYAPLIKASVAHMCPPSLSMQDRVDLTDEAEQIFLNAVSSFDLTQTEVSFGLYAKVCLHNGLVSELRRITSRNRLVVVPMPDEDLSGGEDPAASVEEEESFSQLCGIVRSTLSEFENQVWWAYVSGSSASDIAARLGRDEKSIHNAVYRIRRKLRERLTVQQ